MIFRSVALAAGLCCGVVASQGPEFSQQYTQRLAGAVDELSGVVAQFDADAAELGLSREAALADLAGGSDMAQARGQSMGAVLARYERLSTHLAVAREGSVLAGMRFVEPGLARATWADYAPAVPVTVAGLGFGVGGFALGYGVIVLLVGGLAQLRRRDVARG